jgi:hypothetical protein
MEVSVDDPPHSPIEPIPVDEQQTVSPTIVVVDVESAEEGELSDEDITDRLLNPVSGRNTPTMPRGIPTPAAMSPASTISRPATPRGRTPSVAGSHRDDSQTRDNRSGSSTRRHRLQVLQPGQPTPSILTRPQAAPPLPTVSGGVPRTPVINTTGQGTSGATPQQVTKAVTQKTTSGMMGKRIGVRANQFDDEPKKEIELSFTFAGESIERERRTVMSITVQSYDPISGELMGIEERSVTLNQLAMLANVPGGTSIAHGGGAKLVEESGGRYSNDRPVKRKSDDFYVSANSGADDGEVPHPSVPDISGG